MVSPHTHTPQFRLLPTLSPSTTCMHRSPIVLSYRNTKFLTLSSTNFILQSYPLASCLWGLATHMFLVPCTVLGCPNWGLLPTHIDLGEQPPNSSPASGPVPSVSQQTLSLLYPVNLSPGTICQMGGTNLQRLHHKCGLFWSLQDPCFQKLLSLAGCFGQRLAQLLTEGCFWPSWWHGYAS